GIIQFPFQGRLGSAGQASTSGQLGIACARLRHRRAMPVSAARRADRLAATTVLLCSFLSFANISVVIETVRGHLLPPHLAPSRMSSFVQHRRLISRFSRVALGVLAFVTLPLTATLQAQSSPATEAEVAALRARIYN